MDIDMSVLEDEILYHFETPCCCGVVQRLPLLRVVGLRHVGRHALLLHTFPDRVQQPAHGRWVGGWMDGYVGGLVGQLGG